MGLRGPKPKRREVIWSSELAYAIGLITTDGCLSNDGRHITLVSKDMEQIRNFKKCLKLKTKVDIHKSGRKNADRTYYRVQWSDVGLYDFLLAIGLMPRKSRIIGELKIPDQYFFDFLRGDFDGDGSFYSYFDPRWKSSFMHYLSFTSASLPHLDWMREVLRRLLGVKGHISKMGGKEGGRNLIANLRFAKKESLLVLHAMYSTSCQIHLSRKRLKIVRALRIVNESLIPLGKKIDTVMPGCRNW